MTNGKKMEELSLLKQKLITQYNSQNDTRKPTLNDEYCYYLTETEFSLLETTINQMINNYWN